MSQSSALFTDRYEINGAQVGLYSGVGEQACVFEVFARSLPVGRRYGILAGLERLLRGIENFNFGEAEIDFLRQNRIGDERILSKIVGQAFQGDIYSYREGEVYFPYSPVLRVEGSFVECVLLETLVLGILNWDSGIASTAARMVSAANGRGLIEMASRRVHEEAAVATARAAYIAGFDATSNLEAGRRWGVPTAGTAQHALVLAYEREADAFAAQIAVLDPGTTLLVDTYDWRAGLQKAVQAAGTGLGAVRIDCGDLDKIVPEARSILDNLGATRTRIICSGGLDELDMERLVALGTNGFGAGERLVFPRTGGSPGFVYKLVQIGAREVAKRSEGKGNFGGRKVAMRQFDEQGVVMGEKAIIGGEDGAGVAMQIKVIENGQRVWNANIADIRDYCSKSRASLSEEDLRLTPGGARIVCQMQRLTNAVASQGAA